MNEYLFGITHPGRTNYDALKDAGINTIRVDIPFPFADQAGEYSPAFQQVDEWVREIVERGFTVIGISPYPKAIPHWEGEPATSGWFRTLREACAFLADHFAAEIPIWQCTNEMNVPHFREPLEIEDAIRFVEESARGIREGSPGAHIGANMGGFNDLALEMYSRLYRGGNGIAWDYIGADGYFGTWERGGSHTWQSAFDQLAAISDLPVIVMEWGYSSAGGIMPAEEVVEGATDPHAHRKWCFGWEMPDGTIRPHDAATQARYIEETLPILRERSIASVYYCMSDSALCWCKHSDCPVESNWGLLNAHGEKKPSYEAMRRAIRELKQ